MKIVHNVMNIGSGGIAGFLLSLATQQVKDGHSVTIVVVEEYAEEKSLQMKKNLEDNGVNVVCLYKKRHNKMSMIRTLFLNKKVIKKIQPDIVNSHSMLCHFYSEFACWGISAVHVATLHNTPERWPIYDRIFCCNTPLIACSKAAYEGRIQKNKIVTYSDNGVSADVVRTDLIVDLRKELNLPPDTKIVVSVGNLRPQKNYRNLIELAKLYNGSNVHFVICGAKTDVWHDDPQIYDGYENLHCIGARTDVSAIENGADLFLSSSKFEGLPIAVLEAYFNGIPCVLSPIKEHIQISDVAKVWIPLDFELSSFSDCIDKALNVKDSHDKIYAERKEQIEKYSITRTSIEYTQFYNKCINL